MLLNFRHLEIRPIDARATGMHDAQRALSVNMIALFDSVNADAVAAGRKCVNQRHDPSFARLLSRAFIVLSATAIASSLRARRWLLRKPLSRRNELLEIDVFRRQAGPYSMSATALDHFGRAT